MVVTPLMMITLGSFAYIFSILEVVADGFLVWKYLFERNNELAADVLGGEVTGVFRKLEVIMPSNSVMLNIDAETQSYSLNGRAFD